MHCQKPNLERLLFLSDKWIFVHRIPSDFSPIHKLECTGHCGTRPADQSCLTGPDQWTCSRAVAPPMTTHSTSLNAIAMGPLISITQLINTKLLAEMYIQFMLNFISIHHNTYGKVICSVFSIPESNLS